LEVLNPSAAGAFRKVLHGETLAGLDEPSAAIEETRRARALLPKTRDALSGARVPFHAIRVFVLAGAEDAALEELAD
jgi:hypothetical protein